MTKLPPTLSDNVLRISFLIGNLNKEHGGAQQLLYDLCRHLPEDEFDLTIYYLFGEGTFQPDLEAAGAQVVALEANSNYDLRAFGRLVRALIHDHPDVLQTNSPISGAWGRIAGKLTGILHLVGIEHHIHDARRPLSRAVDDLTLPLADSVVGVSEAVRTSFAPWERALIGFASTRLDVISNGVDVDRITVGCRETGILNPYPVEPSDPIVGTVGRHVEAKGYRYLIDAMEHVKREYPNAKLILVGDGPERAALEQRARRLKLLDADGPDTVVFVGQQSSVPPFLAHFDVGVFSSIDESFGLALAETMAAGVPVIGTDIPAFRRILGGGEVGILVPPRNSNALAEAINGLLSDDARREQLQARGRDRIERCFSIDRTAREYAELYRNVADG